MTLGGGSPRPIGRPWAMFVLAAVLLVAAAPAKPPTLDRLVPPGGQRGQTVEVTAEGTFETWPPRVWVEGHGVAAQASATKGKLTATLAPDALGVAWIRLYDDRGASEARPFLVGNLPEVLEVEPNDAPTAAQAIGGRGVTVNGRLAKPGDVDGFAVELQAGQTLVAALRAHETLGSPMDAVLQVARPDGLVLDQVDDAGGFDPRLAFVAPHAGTFVVRTFAFPAEPDASIRFAGGPAYLYRLTLATDAFADHPLPLSASRGQPGSVQVVGWNLPEAARLLPVAPDPAWPNLAWADHPAFAAPVPVRLVPHPVALEASRLATDPPQAIVAPISLTGRIAEPGERDRYRFNAGAGEPFRFRVASRSLGFPLDPVLRILSANGGILAEVDDAGPSNRDPEYRFAPTIAGDYQIEISDLNGRGGPRHVYQLDFLPANPEVRLTLARRQATLPAEGSLEIAVAVDRRDNYEGLLDISIEGLPARVTATRALSIPKTRTAQSVTLALTSHGASAWSGPIRIVGRALPPRPAPAIVPMVDPPGSAPQLPWLSILESVPDSDEPPCFEDW